MKINNHYVIYVMIFFLTFFLTGCTDIGNDSLQHFSLCQTSPLAFPSVGYALTPLPEHCAAGLFDDDPSVVFHINIFGCTEGIVLSTHCTGDEKKCEAITKGKKCPGNPRTCTIPSALGVEGPTQMDVYDGKDAWCYLAT